jgi:hypothetical protein
MNAHLQVFQTPLPPRFLSADILVSNAWSRASVAVHGLMLSDAAAARAIRSVASAITLAIPHCPVPMRCAWSWIYCAASLADSTLGWVWICKSTVRIVCPTARFVVVPCIFTAKGKYKYRPVIEVAAAGLRAGDPSPTTPVPKTPARTHLLISENNRFWSRRPSITRSSLTGWAFSFAVISFEFSDDSDIVEEGVRPSLDCPKIF